MEKFLKYQLDAMWAKGYDCLYDLFFDFEEASSFKFENFD